MLSSSIASAIRVYPRLRLLGGPLIAGLFFLAPGIPTNVRHRFLAILSFLTLGCGLFYRSPESFRRDVTVQLFQWPHIDVANECESHLAPAGYRWVQVSPPQEHIRGPQWWVDYQPVSYILNSKRGSPQQFVEMVNRCNAAGVGVIVDAVVNHMTSGRPEGFGTSGSSFSHYSYDDIYDYHDFHHCGRNGNDHISDYTDRYEVQNCELLGLADLATETTKVRDTIGTYLDSLARIGVTGFRMDASKHMPATDIRAILQRVTNRGRMHIVQEVIFGFDEPIRPEEYIMNGNVHVFQGASDLKRLFKTDGMAHLVHPVGWGSAWGNGYLASEHSTVFVTNHDLERSGGSLVAADPQYLLAHVFILTWSYGQVDILSGYNFTNFDDGPSQFRVHCGQFGWRCEHRHPMIVGAIQIRGRSGSQPVRNIITSGSNRTAYSRGSKGFIALNNEPEEWILPPGTQIGMKPGDYPDVLGSNQIVVRVGGRGRLIDSIVIPGFSAVGIHL
ncbi:alpha-amylase [Melampsora larici-populina 98AG31]|uniref:Alpha-amylase n=1 Tax=Melampsora larici-populina (strain 98AG31 / pathotype 3-4-7) TaxID=747676 RepID=F4RXF9_MELLP|nr:alpha-amylase [Melampsora larici-populina 98AG31]EGG02960.1 alpha-amylase [Melampsora larici-populina 98AG31]